MMQVLRFVNVRFVFLDLGLKRFIVWYVYAHSLAVSRSSA